MRRKLKKLRRMVDAGKVGASHVEEGHRSWRETVEGQRGNERRLASIDKLYRLLFGGDEWITIEL